MRETRDTTLPIQIMDDDDRDPWLVEADTIALEWSDFDVAECAEPCDDDENCAFGDLEFDELEECREWLEALLEFPCALLALEQSCVEGRLLRWEMRAVRLSTAPDEALSLLHRMWDACSHGVRSALACYVYWLVRAERARRTGRPDWSPKDPLPPVERQSAFYKRRPLVFRRQT